MLEVVSTFIIGLLTFYVGYYVFSIITCHKLIINKKIIIYSIILGLVSTVTSISNHYELRALSYNVIANIMHMHTYKEKINRTFLTALLNYILMMISETIFTLIVIYLFQIPVTFFSDTIIGVITVNSVVLLLTLILIRIKVVKNLFKTILKWYEDYHVIKFIILIIVAFVLIAFFTYQNFIGIHSMVYFVEINIALILVFVFVIGYFNQKAKNQLILTDYDQLLEYVKTYEKIADEKSKNQHEYKNQLILLKSMIKDDNKKSINYINKLLKIEDEQESYQYLEKLKNLPTGGLKGFILYKIDTMLEKGIVPFVDISDTLSSSEVWKICEDNLQDISRAIGVYLDNAIEAACNSKDKYLLIDADYIDDSVTFTFSNTFNGNIDFEKMGKVSYSTKGKGRGYGLVLIKDIIDKNKNLSQYREINGIYYVQKLIIKK